MNLEPLSLSEYIKQLWRNILSPLLTVTAWYILKFSVKVYIIMFLYNLVAPVFYTNAPQLLYGHAFAATALITIIFSDLDSYSKANNQILLNINGTLWQLINNQIKQNNGILSYLNYLSTKKVANVLDVEHSLVDTESNTDYNTQESEKTE